MGNVWIILLLSVVVLGVGLGLFAAVAALRRGSPRLDLAPGWWLRCPVCGRAKRLSEVGGVRLGAASRGKRTLGRCTACRKLRLLRVVHVSSEPGLPLPEADQPARPARPGADPPD